MRLLARILTSQMKSGAPGNKGAAGIKISEPVSETLDPIFSSSIVTHQTRVLLLS